MVIKHERKRYRTDEAYLEQVPTTPPAVNKNHQRLQHQHHFLKNLSKGSETRNAKTAPEQLKLPELPKKPVPKPLLDAGSVVVGTQKPTLNRNQWEPPLTPTPENQVYDT